MKQPKTIDLSIIVTAHSEGILLHKTLKSIDRATALLTTKGYVYEVILHLDSPAANTLEYLGANKDYLDRYTIFTNSFGDAGASRNFAVSKATGIYATFIDGDDLVSQNWFVDALQYLIKHSDSNIIAHAELTLEFGATSALVQKHGEIDQATDSLLSVYANRWNAILMTSRSILLKHPYTVDPEGFGFEDWHLNNTFIYEGYHNVLIPQTVIFVRRKETGSRWAAHQGNQSILKANPLLSFKHIRSLPKLSATVTPALSSPSLQQRAFYKGKRLLQRYPGLYNKARHYHAQFRDPAPATADRSQMPDWLLAEWQNIHSIEKKLFPSHDNLQQTALYDSITPAHWQVGHAYKRVVDALAHDSYDYILFVPWVINGGADKFAIAYANQIQVAEPKKRVLVLATLPVDSPWRNNLRTDFLSFGELTADLDTDLQMRVLEQVIENSGAQYLHIINSALGYAFVKAHASYVKGSNKHLIVSSFSQSIDNTGYVFGYSHTHVPEVYELCDVVASDNQTVLDMWHNEYGFDTAKLALHHPSIETRDIIRHDRPLDQPLRVLWAARVAPEKIPHLVVEIGELLQGQAIIDMYGHVDESIDQSFLQSLPANVTYNGGYNDFFLLPIDQYDAFLYTSLFDGMPNVLLEAGSVGLPIVASAVGGVPELIHDKETGILIQETTNATAYANALTTLRQDKKLRLTLSGNLHKRLAADYSAAAYRDRVTAMLKHISYL